MGKKIKCIFVFLLSGSLLFTSGCWDYKEYENLALVSAVGIDTDGTARQITATVQYLVPGGSNATLAGGGGSKSLTGTSVVKATGLSVGDAFAEIQEAVGKKLFFGYMQELVLGKDAAELIAADMIGYINRTPNIRTSSYIVVTPGRAEDVLTTMDSNVTETPAKNIHNLIDQSLNSGRAYPVTIQKFGEALSISGEEAVAPMITVDKTEKQSGNSSGSNSSGASADMFKKAGNSVESGAVVLSEFNNGYHKINGMAAFNEDKLIGWLTDKECLGLSLINNVKTNPYEIVNTTSTQNVANTLIYRVTRSKSKIKVIIENNKPIVNIETYVEAELRKYAKNMNAKLLTPDAVDMLQKGLADKVKADVYKAVNKSQKELKSDVLRIGFNLYRQYPQLWHSKYEKQWNKIFPTVQINVNVTAKVVDTGTSIGKFEPK